jgi:hypothetical protein
VISKRTKRAAAKILSSRAHVQSCESAFIGSLDEDLREYGTGIKLADALKISQQYLSDLRAGKRGFTDDFLHKIAASDI